MKKEVEFIMPTLEENKNHFFVQTENYYFSVTLSTVGDNVIIKLPNDSMIKIDVAKHGGLPVKDK